jgi:hypothetical protein
MLKKMTALGIALLGLLFKNCTLPDGLKNGYYVQNDQVVYFHGFPATGTVLQQADPKTFETIFNDFGKDKNHVYYTDSIITGADPSSFQHLGNLYSKDRQHGFFAYNTISNDGSHFEIVPNCQDKPYSDDAASIIFARDRFKVYNGEFVLEGADPGTFVFVPMFNGYDLAHDKNYVYWKNAPLPGVDGASFKRVCELNFKDKNGAWYISLGKDVTWERMTPAIDLPTFVGIQRFYSQDKNGIYYGNTVVKDADRATFKESSDYQQAHDKNNKYSSGYPIKADTSKTK